MSAYDRFTGALAVRGCAGRGSSWQCPGHDDRSPSLSVNPNATGDGIVIRCHAGCETADVVNALGLGLGDLYDEPRTERPRHVASRKVAEYSYCDEHGELLYSVHRFEPGFRDGDKKSFAQYAPDGTKGIKGIRRVLYRLPEVVAQVAAGGTVIVVEGEKDVDNLFAAGAVATCNPGGTGMGWSEEYTRSLIGADEVAVIIDKDRAGRKHGAKVAASLRRAGVPVRVVEPAAGKDVTEHLNYGLDFAALVPVDLDTVPSTEDRESFDALIAPDEEPPPPDEPAGRRLRVTPLSGIRLRATYWVWEDRIPVGGLTLWAGREGIGKSTSAAWLAAHVTRGTLPGAHHGRPRSVFYAASEDSWERTVAPRLVAAGADLDRTFRIDVTEDERPGVAMPLTLPSDTSSLGRELDRYDVGLLIVDPLVSALNGGIDTHRDREVRSALEPLTQVADQAGAAVLGLVHFGKGASTDPLSLILGSRAFAATARAVICMARDPESEDGTVVLSQEKNNLGRLDLPSLTYVVASTEVATEDGISYVGRVEFTGQSERSVSDMLADGAMSNPSERGERDEAVAWLVDYLVNNGGEASAGDVIKAGEKDGFAKHTIQRARSKAGVTSQKSGFGKGWVWVLNTGATPEGDTKTTKNTEHGALSPSSPSVSSSARSTDKPALTMVPDPPRCTVCRAPLDPTHAGAGETACPGCAA